MNTLIIILIVLATIVALILVIAAFLKKEIVVTRQVTIARPVPDVFNYIRFLKNQENYSRWVMADPSMQKTFSGNDGSEGFVYGWNSKDKKVGEGAQEIKKLVPNQRMENEIRFVRPFPGIALTDMNVAPGNGNSTNVNWNFKCIMKYPMNVMQLFMNPDKMLGGDMEASLALLKKNLENNNS